MKKDFYDLKIGDMADFFGVSTDTLRIYDRKGIVSPKKNPENGYRTYSREDFLMLEYVFELKKAGMSLEEIRQIANEDSLEEIIRKMELQSEFIDSKILEYQNLKRIIGDYINGYSNTLHNLGKISVTTSPRFIEMPIQDSVIRTVNEFNVLTEWFMPRFTYVIPKSSLSFVPEKNSLPQFKALQKEMTYSVTLEDPGIFKDYPSLREKGFHIVEPQKCVHAAIIMETGRNYDEFMNCIQYLIDNKMKMTGDAWLRTVSIKNYDLGYYDLWIPVE